MRRTGTSTSRSAATPHTVSYRIGTSTIWIRARGVEGAAQARSARLRAVEGGEAGRGHRLGLAVGPGPARMAHRVLGDGGVAARRRFRDPRRRLGPDLPPPRERGRPDRRRARRAAGAAVGPQRDDPARQEKMSKSVGNIFVLRDALDALRPRRADHVLRSAATTGSRSSSTRSGWRRRRRGVAPDPGRARGGSTPVPRPEWSAPLQGALLRRARERLQHAAALAAVVRRG